MKYILNNFVIFIDDISDIDTFYRIVITKYQKKYFKNSYISKKELIDAFNSYKHKLIVYFSYNLFGKNDNRIEFSNLNYFKEFQKDKYIFYNIKDFILREKVTTLYEKE